MPEMIGQITARQLSHLLVLGRSIYTGKPVYPIVTQWYDAHPSPTAPGFAGFGKQQVGPMYHSAPAGVPCVARG